MTEQTAKNTNKRDWRASLILGALVIVCSCGLLMFVFGSSGSKTTTTVPTSDVAAIYTQAYWTAIAALPTRTAIPPAPKDTAIPTQSETPEPYLYLYEAAPYIFLDHDSYRGNGAGIKVYMGEQKAYVFEIIGGGSCTSMPSGQGYLVRYPNSNEAWKDRRAMEESELFVVNDSFALYARDWKVYYNCP